MKDDKEYSKFVSDIGKMFHEIQKLHQQRIEQIKPEIEQLMISNSRDVERISVILDEMLDNVLFGVGMDLFFGLLDYLETFAPQRANEIRETHEDLTGMHEDIIEAAKGLAQELHQGQTDKAGKDYFTEHLCRVADMGHNWKDKVVGYLHDAAEDTQYTTDQVMQMLQKRCGGQLREKEAQQIHEALNLMNSNTAPSRKDYIDRLSQNEIATRVKLNDLKHNMDLSRLENPTSKDIERMQRYQKEYRQILGYLGEVYWKDDDETIGVN